MKVPSSVRPSPQVRFGLLNIDRVLHNIEAWKDQILVAIAETQREYQGPILASKLQPEGQRPDERIKILVTFLVRDGFLTSEPYTSTDSTLTLTSKGWKRIGQSPPRSKDSSALGRPWLRLKQWLQS